MTGKGSNSVKIRHYNERFVLDAVRRLRQASKSDLARAANLTPAAVADIVDGLESSGLVIQIGKRFGQRGSPSVLYQLMPGRVFSVGVKIGRRATDTVLLDFAGDVRERTSHEYAFPDPDQIRRIGQVTLSNYLALVGKDPKARIVGLGIAAPYFLGGWSEELGFPTDMDQRWARVNIATLFNAPADMPVLVENDASSAALAELAHGTGERFRDFMHISVDTFVGGGLVQAGELQTGPNGNSAALGPFPVSPSRLPSMIGLTAPYPSLLHRASVYVLVNHLRYYGVTFNRVRELDPLPEAMRRPVFEWIDDCSAALSEAIIGIVSVLDLNGVVLDSILPRPLHRELLARVQARFADTGAVGILAPEIVSGNFGAEAATVGAAMLPFSALYAPDRRVLMIGHSAAAPSARLSHEPRNQSVL